MSETTPPFRRYTRKGRESRTSAGDQNRLRETVEHHDRITADPRGGLLVERIGGLLQFDPNPGEVLGNFWIQITGGASSPYTSWSEVQDNGDGTFSALADGIAGNGSYQAYEVNAAKVPANKVCRAWLSADEQSVLFAYPGTTFEDVTITQAVNGDNALILQRITDTTPTGNLLVLETAAGATLVQISVAGVYTVNLTALGVSTTQAINIENTTVAALGAQQVSPSFVWTGQGWETNTSASQTVQFQAFVLPVQGAANPSGTWELQASINGAAYANVLTVSSGGTVTATAFSGDGSALTNVPAPLAAALIAKGAAVWQQYKIKVNAGTVKWDVTNPDGTVTSTAMAAALTQTLNLNAAEPAGTTVVAAQWNIPTAVNIVTNPTGQLGYSGGDTSGGASAFVVSTYSGNNIFLLGTTNTRVSTKSVKDFTNANDACPNTTTTWTLTCTITSAGGNLNTITAGEFHVWFLLGTAAAP